MGNVLRLAGLASLGIGLVLAGVAAFSGNAAPVGDVACKMAVKERVLSGVYKSYGMTECPVPLWLAKSVFKNNTDARITKLRLRYKVGEYADCGQKKRNSVPFGTPPAGGNGTGPWPVVPAPLAASTGRFGVSVTKSANVPKSVVA